MPKTIVGIIAGGTLLVGGGAMTADHMVDPYQDVSVTYSDGTTAPSLEITKDSVLPEAGTDATIVDTTQPKITLSKWNGEVALGVTYEGIQSTGSRPFLSKNVDWSQGAQTMEAVPIDATTTMEDGGMEININLASKPASNVFTFQLNNWQNLDFFYQAPLTADEIKEGASRPDNVVGSYAVYYRNHADHIEGQTNYATGKAYHIFRPLVTDAKGNTIWADLSYLDGVLTVTVPQSFLDGSAYPVKIDPTFGYSTCGATAGGWGINQTVGSENGPAVSGTGQTVTSITLCSNIDGSGITNIKGYITDTSFSIIAGSITSGQLIVAPSPGSIQTISYSGPSVTNGTTYYPWIIASGNWSTMQDSGAGGNSAFKTTGTTYVSPSNPTSPTVQAVGRSIFATYTASGGGGTTPNSSYIVRFQ
jgi:hypothetical protein